MKKILKNEIAISLLALVITIVILIILASVAITMSFSNNGLFPRVKQAKENYKISMNEEELGVAKLANDIATKDEVNDEIHKESELDSILEKAGITQKFESLADVFNNEEAAKKIVQNKELLRECIDNSNITNLIIQSENTKSLLKSSEYCVKTPILTSNTPNVLKSSEYSNNAYWGAYKVFDGRVGKGEDALHWSSNADTNQYVGYKFDEDVWVFEVNIENAGTDNFEHGAKTVQIEFSDDDINYYPISDIITINPENEIQSIPINNHRQKHKYWRLYIYDGYGTEFISISELSFYGLAI